MRRKTSLTLEATVIAAAKTGAEQRGLPDEDQAVLAAFAEADRQAHLGR
jgi:hypothetical protein